MDISLYFSLSLLDFLLGSIDIMVTLGKNWLKFGSLI